MIDIVVPETMVLDLDNSYLKCPPLKSQDYRSEWKTEINNKRISVSDRHSCKSITDHKLQTRSASKSPSFVNQRIILHLIIINNRYYITLSWSKMLWNQINFDHWLSTTTWPVLRTSRPEAEQKTMAKLPLTLLSSILGVYRGVCTRQWAFGINFLMINQ